MKPGILVGLSLAVALAVSACSTAAPATSSSTQPTAAAPAAAATTVPATAVPASPTVAPTIAPTVVPTIAPSPTQAPVPTAAPTNTAAAQAALSGPAASVSDFQPMAEALAAAKSYRMTITTTSGPSGQTGTIVVDIVKPDRMHTTLDMGGQKFETIVIGTTSYMNIGGTWRKSPVANPAAITSALLSNDPQKLLGQINTSQKDGTLTKGTIDTVDGTQCQNWVWTPSASAASQSGGTICIGVHNNLPVEFKSNDGKVVAKYSDWNGAISIEPPI